MYLPYLAICVLMDHPSSSIEQCIWFIFLSALSWIFLSHLGSDLCGEESCVLRILMMRLILGVDIVERLLCVLSGGVFCVCFVLLQIRSVLGNQGVVWRCNRRFYAQDDSECTEKTCCGRMRLMCALWGLIAGRGCGISVRVSTKCFADSWSKSEYAM